MWSAKAGTWRWRWPDSYRAAIARCRIGGNVCGQTELRKEKKISQTELAQQLDLHKNVLGRYERDQAKPAIDIAAKFAKHMNVSLDYLPGTPTLMLMKDC